VVDREPLIFRDPVAADLIGAPGAEMVGYHRSSGDHIVLAGTRTQVTVRSRWTEERLATLAAGGGLAAGSELAMEYALPPGLRNETGAAYAGFALAVAAERGEPWLSFFTPGQLSGLLQASGMTVAEQVRQRGAVPAVLWDRSDALRPLDLCRLARATVSP